MFDIFLIYAADELIHLQTGDEELVTTCGHPFFIYGHGFEYAGNLRAGDILVNVNGERGIKKYLWIRWSEYEFKEGGISNCSK